MIITRTQALAWRPGRRLRRTVRALIAEQGITQAQIAALDMPHRDRFWLLLHCVSPNARRRAAALLAQRAATVSGTTSPGILGVPKVVRDHIGGSVTDVQLAASRSAALDAIATATSEQVVMAARAAAIAAIPMARAAVNPDLPQPELRAARIAAAFHAWKAPAVSAMKAASYCALGVAWTTIWLASWQATWEAARHDGPVEVLLSAPKLAALRAAEEDAWNTIIAEALDRVSDLYADPGLNLDIEE